MISPGAKPVDAPPASFAGPTSDPIEEGNIESTMKRYEGEEDSDIERVNISRTYSLREKASNNIHPLDLFYNMPYLIAYRYSHVCIEKDSSSDQEMSTGGTTVYIRAHLTPLIPLPLFACMDLVW